MHDTKKAENHLSKGLNINFKTLTYYWTSQETKLQMNCFLPNFNYNLKAKKGTSEDPRRVSHFTTKKKIKEKIEPTTWKEKE